MHKLVLHNTVTVPLLQKYSAIINLNSEVCFANKCNELHISLLLCVCSIRGKIAGISRDLIRPHKSAILLRHNPPNVNSFYVLLIINL